MKRIIRDEVHNLARIEAAAAKRARKAKKLQRDTSRSAVGYNRDQVYLDDNLNPFYIAK